MEQSIERNMRAEQEMMVICNSPEATVIGELRKAQDEIKATNSSIDSVAILSLLVSKAFSSSVVARLLMDRNSLLGPFYVKQSGQLREFVERSERWYTANGVYPLEARS
jgi:hypothetical protein